MHSIEPFSAYIYAGLGCKTGNTCKKIMSILIPFKDAPSTSAVHKDTFGKWWKCAFQFMICVHVVACN